MDGWMIDDSIDGSMDGWKFMWIGRLLDEWMGC
jgi:hypothetical protein